MSKTDPIIMQAEILEGKINEITDRLEQGVVELFESDRYKEYLKVMSKFYEYSLNNTVLIAMQKPDATLVAGYNTWKKVYGRHVKKDEKGIRILAPSPYKIRHKVEKKDPQTGKTMLDKDGKPVTEEKEITIPAFKVVSVFDVSQTEGRELPSISVNELTGNVEKYEDFYTALEKTSPVPICFEKIEGTAHGYYHLEDKRIVIQKDMSELQTLKTVIHEIAHAKLHDTDLKAPKDTQKQLDRRTREVQAESVAYTVCQHYNLDTSDYSFGYVAGWSGGRDLAELRGSLETIRKAAAEIISSIHEYFVEIQNIREASKIQKADNTVVEPNVNDIDFFENLSKNDREGMLNALSIAALDVRQANFTENGNAVESQEAILVSGENRASVRFYNWWNPMQIIKPSKPIRQKIEVVAYKNGNPTAICTLVEMKSTSLKNAEKNYQEILNQWKRLTKQQMITFGPISGQHSNRSVLNKLHENQDKTMKAARSGKQQKEKEAVR